MLSPEFHLPSPKARTKVVGGVSYGVELKLELIDSCNGLICLLKRADSEEDNSVYISNPVLGEYVKLKLPKLERRASRVNYRFCFNEVCGEYKVLRSVTRSYWHRRDVSSLKVYTLGIDKKWRNLGEAPYALDGKANAKGAHHWMNNENPEKRVELYSFDIGTEKVKCLPIPPYLERGRPMLILGELRNCLCLSEIVYNHHISIWWMKEYGKLDSWTKLSFLTCCIPPEFRYEYYLRPIVIWKDGEILMQRDHGTLLVSYNPKDKKFREVNVNGSGSAAFSSTRYIPSFYSLKTLMGDNFQVSNVYPKTKIV